MSTIRHWLTNPTGFLGGMSRLEAAAWMMAVSGILYMALALGLR